MIKLLLPLLLLTSPLQATTEEPSMQIICDELLIELAIAIDDGLLTSNEAQDIGFRCENLI